MVGALADWFAVTALFRHPLGHPDPAHGDHPQAARTRSGAASASSCRATSSPARCSPSGSPASTSAQRLGRWLAEPAQRRAGGGRRRRRHARHDRGARRPRRPGGHRRARRAAAAGDRGRPAARQGDRRRRRGRAPPAAARRRAQRARRRSSTTTGRRCAQRLEQGVAVVGARADRRPHLQEDLQRRAALPRRRRAPTRTTRCGASIEERVRTLAERLRDDPELIAKGEELKHELLVAPRGAGLAAVAVGRAEAGDADGRRRSRQRAAPPARRRAGAASGERLVDRRRAAGQGRRLGRARRRPTSSSNYRGEVADLIATTVERWDGADTSRRIELQVGRDLQFIRINGTVVGGLAGLADPRRRRELF